MKEFACGDVVPGCAKVLRAEDEDGLFEQIGRHASEDHGMTEVPGELLEQVRTRIRDIP